MSVWKKANEEKPPLNEDVLILYKHKHDELKEKICCTELQVGFKTKILVLKDGHILLSILDILK